MLSSVIINIGTNNPSSAYLNQSSQVGITKVNTSSYKTFTHCQRLKNNLKLKNATNLIRNGLKYKSLNHILFLFTLCISNTLAAQSCSEELIDSLNNNVSGLISIIDSQRVVVGHDDKVYIYTHDGANWNISDSLSTTSGNISDIESDKDRVVLSNHHTEQIHIFDWDGTVWNETIINDTQNETFWFGLNIALHKDRLVVGGHTDNNFNFPIGLIYIYDFDGSNWTLTEVPESNGKYTGPIDVFEDRVVVGNAWTQVNNGIVHVYEFDGTDWVEETLSNGFINQWFGNSVAIYDSTIVIGAYSDDEGCINSGSAYVFRKTGGDWVEQRITPSELVCNGQFGAAVDIYKDKVVVSEIRSAADSGRVHIFTLCPDNFSFSQTTIKPSTSHSGDNFGYNVAIDSELLLVGSDRTTNNKAFIFSCDYSSNVQCPGFQPFITTWKTDNLPSSNASSITIPTNGPGYYYDVDWDNDGIYDDLGVTGDITHNYSTPGTYTVNIRGIFPRIYFNNQGDRNKILSVEQWGDIYWKSMASAFYGCSNLEINATDVPDMYSVINTSQMFRNATSFNSPLTGWNLQLVSNISFMFSGATSFNQDISGLDFRNVQNAAFALNGASAFDQDLGQLNFTNKLAAMNGMLDNSGLSKQNYDKTLIGWYNRSRAIFGGLTDITLGSTNLTYCLAEEERQLLIDTYNWSIGGDSEGCSPFVTTWKTDGDGSSSSSITIPTRSGLTYSYDVDWDNDGIYDDIGVSGDITHDYGTPGTYTVAITGTFPQIRFAGGGNERKILSIDQWGDIEWERFESSFWQCRNLIMTDTISPILENVSGGLHFTFFQCFNLTGDFSNWDVSSIDNMISTFESCPQLESDLSSWDVSNITSMKRMFNGCAKFNSDISQWDISSVTNMERALAGTLRFDQDLSSWDISSVTNMTSMLDQAGLSIANYDLLLNSWPNNNPQPNITLGAYNLEYCDGEPGRNDLINNYNWNITSDIKLCGQIPFVTIWNANPTVTIPTYPGETYNYDIDWDYDGIYDDIGVTGDITHTYSGPGQRTIAIRGTFPRIYINNNNSEKNKLLSIQRWGEIEWESMENAFFGCYFLRLNALDAPNLDSVESTKKMFSNAFGLTNHPPLDLQNWDVSNVKDMSEMFSGAFEFNGVVSNWDVSNVTTMFRMFSSCLKFTSDLSNWDVSKVTNMSYAFSSNTLFTSDLSSWDVSNVTNFIGTFRAARAFTSDLSNWDVSNANAMSGMFEFAHAFNSDLNSWDISNITSLEDMFKDALSFNSNLCNWNTQNVTNFSETFHGASSFDQSLENWNLSNASSLQNMLSNCGMDEFNYDQTIIGWSGQSVATNLTLGSVGLNYCQSTNERNTLINSRGWNIIGDQENCTLCYLPNLDIYLDNSGMAIIDIQNIDFSSLAPYDSIWLGIDTFDCTFTCNTLYPNTVYSIYNLDTSTCILPLSVLDTIAPSITCQDLTIDLNKNLLSQISIEDVLLDVSDNCNTPSLSLSVNSFSCDELDMPQQTLLVAKDIANNMSSCTSTITLTDSHGYCCPDSLIVNYNPIDSVNYYASTHIKSNGQVIAQKNVNFRAPMVHMESDFTVDTDALFEVIIEQCEKPTNPLDFAIPFYQDKPRLMSDTSLSPPIDNRNIQTVEWYNDKLYYLPFSSGSIEERDPIDYSLIRTIVPSVSGYYNFLPLPGDRFALFSNTLDVVFVIDNTGSLLTTANLLPQPDSRAQTVEGVVVGDQLIISENGNRQVMQLNLNTYQMSVFKDLNSVSSQINWLGAITHDQGTFYIVQPNKVYKFTETGTPELICTLPAQNNTGIAVRDGYAYVSNNFGYSIYKIDLSDGSFETYKSFNIRPNGISLK